MCGFDVKTPLLAMCLKLNGAVIQDSMAGSANSRDCSMIQSFCNALTKYVGDSVKRMDSVQKRWGALSLSARLTVVAEAERHGCAQDLAALVGDLPFAESVPSFTAFQPMF